MRFSVSEKAGLAAGGSGNVFYFVEEIGRDEKKRRKTADLIRIADTQRTPLLRYEMFDNAGLDDAAAVSPDESAVAYITSDGLRLRIFASGQDMLISGNDRSGCPGNPAATGGLQHCFGHIRVEWTDNRILATRVQFETVWTFVFEPRMELQAGRRLEFLASAPGRFLSQFCTDDGDHFSGRGPNNLVFDIATDVATTLERPDGMRVSSGCAMNAAGDVAGQWDHKIPGGAVRLFTRDHRPFLTARIPSDVTILGWVGEAGVVFSDPARSEGPRRYLFLDRAGDWWTLPIVADSIGAIVAE